MSLDDFFAVVHSEGKFLFFLVWRRSVRVKWKWNRMRNWAFVCTRSSIGWSATFINSFYHFFPFSLCRFQRNECDLLFDASDQLQIQWSKCKRGKRVQQWFHCCAFIAYIAQNENIPVKLEMKMKNRIRFSMSATLTPNTMFRTRYEQPQIDIFDFAIFIQFKCIPLVHW